jgi:hypothetical protein
MRWEGYRSVAVRKLDLPGDIPARMKLPHVIELAASIKKLGADPIHAPSIDGATNKLLAGRDRMAALLLNNAKAVWCHVAGEVSEQDALDLEVDENLHRRQDNRDDLIARRVAKVAGQLPDEMSNNGPGRKKTRETRAREQVAQELGTTPEAVRAATKRAAEPDEEPAGPVELAPPVETWGVPVEHLAQEFASVRIAQEAMRAADRSLQQAQRVLSGMEDSGGIAAQLGVVVYNSVHQAAALLRSRIPTALCPYCKGLANRRARCTGCGGLGYVSKDALLGVADELKQGGALACVPDGKGGFVLVSAQRSNGAKPDPVKKLQLQDADGNPIEVPGEDEPF